MKGLGIGRILRFVLPNGEIRPAIVTRVIDKKKGRVGLFVFADAADPPGIAYDPEIGEPGVADYCEDGTPGGRPEDYKPGTWHWPVIR